MAARMRRGSGGKAKRKTAPTAAQKMNSARANKLAAFGFTGFLVLMAGAAAIALDIPAKAALQAGEAVGNAGFRVNGYQIVGIKHMDHKLIDAVVVDELHKAAAATGQNDPAQPLVDVAAIRNRLLQFGWVQDARVSRRLPDTLVIDVVERTPSALWQDRERLALIDAHGIVLDRVPVDKMPDLPLVIGPGANRRSSDLKTILAGSPAMQAQLASATWVGGRRWDLAFQSGETVALPEGVDAARDALARFAKADRSSGLLGRGLVRFDLRIPGKMIVRLPRSPGEPIIPESAQQPTVEG
ncbi:cell division protein FtsQ/DivIB [Sphingomonas daechungensis]|uniref:cell division protein FtsQ/DivIB n=1 Tax=Sphingomonas daechungensis TaxID=1176646 RepID=UPI0037845149